MIDDGKLVMHDGNMYGNVCLKVNEKGPSRERCCNTPFGAGGGLPPPSSNRIEPEGGHPPAAAVAAIRGHFGLRGVNPPPNVLLKRWGG